MSSYRTSTQTITFAQSATLSSVANLAGYRHYALWIPVINSGSTLTLQGGFDTTSANFLPVQQADLGGAYTLATEVGSKVIDISADCGALAYLRIESDKAQDAARNFVLIGKRS